MRTHHGWVRRANKIFEIEPSRTAKSASPRLKIPDDSQQALVMIFRKVWEGRGHTKTLVTDAGKKKERPKGDLCFRVHIDVNNKKLLY